MQLSNKTITGNRSRYPGVLKMPSNSDYLKILKKLELVISNANYGQRLLILSIEHPLNLFLEKGKSQLIHIHPSGNLTPLHIKFRRAYGKLKTYVSTKIAEPSQELCDFSSISDIIEINDRDLIFHISRIALYVFCLQDCSVFISLRYKAESIKKVENLKSGFSAAKLREELQEDSLDMIIKQEKSRQENNVRRRVKSYTNFREVIERANNTQEKMRMRREMNYQRSRVFRDRSCTSQRSLSDRPEKTQKILTIKGIANYQRILAKLILNTLTLFTFSSALYRKFKKARAKKKQELILSRRINTFKSVYNSWSKYRHKQTALEICRLNLKLFQSFVKPLAVRALDWKLKKIFFHLKTLIVFNNSFGKFFLSVQRIQRHWRKYKLRKCFRIAKLEKLWIKLQKPNRAHRKVIDLPRKVLKSLLDSFYHSFLESLFLSSKSPKSFDDLFSSTQLYSYITGKVQ